IAQCGQCHAEYVGGYSANTGRDGDYFPWAKPNDVETLYWSLFDYKQDWSHGGPIPPWQSTEANARGFTPYGQRYPIGAKLVKVQHPEAEEFLNSPMYNAGATCTDCHSSRVTRPDGTRYTSHWFTSPLKIMDGFSGTTHLGEHIPGEPITLAPTNPCQKCHTTDTIAQSEQRITSQQDQFFLIQERAQVALVNALRYINEQQGLGIDQSANITTYQRASMRWEYYTQAENSMSFHNNPEAVREVANARIWVDNFIPWPLTPAQLKVTAVTGTTASLQWYDQANNETGFIVERGPALEGPYVEVGRVATPNGANFGNVSWTDTGLMPGAKYFYRVAAYHTTTGASVYSIWATGVTLNVPLAPTNLAATAVSSNQIDLTWTDNSAEEAGFRVERATDAGFTANLTPFAVGTNV
ncbi:MAG: ammonia-forming cytochrome c nitrite reductase subunit c552, partial [Chloroflexota bacterium]